MVKFELFLFLTFFFVVQTAQEAKKDISSDLSELSLLEPELTSQEQIYNNALEILETVDKIPIENNDKPLDINSIEPLTGKTFKQLIKKHFGEKVPLIIAEVITKEGTKTVASYYNAYNFTLYLFDLLFFQADPKFASLKKPEFLKALNPINKQPIIFPVRYYNLSSIQPLSFKYLNVFNNELDEVINLLNLSLSEDELLDLFINLVTRAPILSEKYRFFIVQLYLQNIDRLHYENQFALAKIVFDANGYTLAYNLLTRIIENPNIPEALKASAKTLKVEVLSKMPLIDKLKLGLDYFYGELVNVDYKNSLELLENVIRNAQGPLEELDIAKLILARMYIKGLAGIQKNYQRAEILLNSILDSNLLSKENKIKVFEYLLTIYSEGGFGTIKDYDKAISIINKSYNLDPHLFAAYTMIFSIKLFEEKRFISARKYIEKVIDAPSNEPCLNGKAKYVLALIYLNGLEVEKNVERAIKLFKEIINIKKECSNLAKERSYFILAQIYNNGELVPQDLQLAKEFFKIVVESRLPKEFKGSAKKFLKEIEKSESSPVKEVSK